MDRIHQGQIDAEAILHWGYDECLYFMEQDEEVLLQRIDFFPPLAQLARDPQCPKGCIALAIIDSTLRAETLRGDCAIATQANDRALELLDGCQCPGIAEFLKVCHWRVALLGAERAVDRESALQMGRGALLGVSCKGDVRIEEEEGAWKVEMVGTFFSVYPLQRRWLKIDKTTGRFSFGR